jgi:hypothetical protein|tara:strand:+ start:2249 stop:4471 length:2223 start_codon:yes stop_codon:yes gene_type:complete
VTLIPLKFNAGVNKDITRFSNEGGWCDMDKVRFRFGFPEKIGGWQKRGVQSFLGTCRALMSWVTLSRERYIGIGTNRKYYVDRSGQLFDITPIRRVSGPDAIQSVIVDYNSGAAATNGLISAVGNVVAQSTTLPGNTGVQASGSIGAPQVGELDLTSVRNIVMPGVTGSIGDIYDYGDYITSFSVSGVSADTSIHGPHLNLFDDVDEFTLSTTAGSSEVDVTFVRAHGARLGDFVTFSGVIGFDANITSELINQEYEVTEIKSSFILSFNARVLSTISSITVDGALFPVPVLAAATGSGGGTEGTVSFQVNIGLNTSQQYNGWGASGWGTQSWGKTEATDVLRLWHHNNFGEDLILNYRDGSIYYWDATGGVSRRAVDITSFAGSNKAPQIAKQVLVSDRDRHVLAFGCDPESTPGVQDPMVIRFSDSESITDWETRATNTAGELRLGLGSEIIQAVETKQQIIVFTDTTLYAMQFLGPPYTFGVNAISEKISIISPNAAVAVDDIVIWMGKEEFYLYQGSVQKIPCTVRDFVFDALQSDQQEKVVAGLNSSFSEVWWFYPSNSQDINKYVVYNYAEQSWAIGSLSRTAWMDRGLFDFPVASVNNYLYDHERGFDDGENNTAVSSYIESSPVDLGEGDNFGFISRIIPDITFVNSTAANPDPAVNMIIQARNYPGESFPASQTTTSPVTRTATTPIEQFTNEVRLRIRGRSFAFRIESDATGVGWRLGTPRVDIRPDGRR